MTRRTQGQALHLALICGVILLAFGIGARSLDADTVWLDELASLSVFGAFDPPASPLDTLRLIEKYSPADVPIFAMSRRCLGAAGRLVAIRLALLSLPARRAHAGDGLSLRPRSIRPTDGLGSDALDGGQRLSP